MNELQVIDERQLLGRQFRVYGTLDEPLFLAKDVAGWIEHSDVSTMLRNIDENEKVTNIVCTPGGNQEAWFLTEDGLYEVLMQSRKPIAKAFKKEVKNILKDIRKHGMYAKDELLDNPDLLLDVIQKLKQEREEKKLLIDKLEQQKPLVMFAETCIASNDSILVRELAKLASKNGVMIGEKRLYKKLREWGLILNRKNEPSQKAMDAGWFEVKKGTYSTPYGSETYATSLVTPKGQVYIIERLRKEKSEAC